METNSWEATNHSATQEFPSILQNPMVHYCVTRACHWSIILGLINQIHTTPFCFFEFNVDRYTNYQSLMNTATSYVVCDYRWSMDWWLGFIDHLYTSLGTTSTYNTIADFHASQITTTPTNPFPTCYVFTSHSLAMASNSGDSSASHAQVLLTQPPMQNSCQLSCVTVAAGTCLPSCSPEMGLI
jgi:hypothetical protein